MGKEAPLERIIMKRRNRREKREAAVQKTAPVPSLHLEYTIYLKQDYVSDLNEEAWRDTLWALIDGCDCEKGSDADIL